ncbi:unnamed protein product [Litomosoides sigmodontis]|uniref:EF-hand domain-containing protein n=1 Tax=Litomosoides sigmodontis TaxID=42156 RepID=A0A3P6SJW5_LITSI|nr:unnamed protein product [Litomosoides sigmodontis]
MFSLFIVLFILQNTAAQSKTVGNFVAVVRFDEIDDDNDRLITLDELEKWHKMNKIARSGEELREMIRSKDRNGDGMLNIAEFVTLLLMRKIANNEIEKREYKLIDVNNDDKIEFNELTSITGDNSGAQQQPKTGKRQNLAYQLMTLIDQNFDQKLSLQEVQSFASANNQRNKSGIVEEFKYIDSDRDGFLTTNEIIKEPEKMRALVHFQEAPSVIDD